VSAHDLLIIEDAAYAFLAPDPPPPIIELAPERTLYVSGFSKNIATGLRVGFVAAPMHRVDALKRTIKATTWNTPGVMTAITCAWLDDGTVDALETQKRADARARQALVGTVLSGLPVVRHPSSYFLWLPLAEDARADQVALELMREHVSVSTAEPFSTSVHIPHAIRLALGSVSLDTLREALLTVRRVVGAYT
jgi:DNA-binding transcriptional MocR family regulator